MRGDSSAILSGFSDVFVLPSTVAVHDLGISRFFVLTIGTYAHSINSGYGLTYREFAPAPDSNWKSGWRKGNTVPYYTTVLQQMTCDPMGGCFKSMGP